MGRGWGWACARRPGWLRRRATSTAAAAPPASRRATPRRTYRRPPVPRGVGAAPRAFRPRRPPLSPRRTTCWWGRPHDRGALGSCAPRREVPRARRPAGGKETLLLSRTNDPGPPSAGVDSSRSHRRPSPRRWAPVRERLVRCTSRCASTPPARRALHPPQRVRAGAARRGGSPMWGRVWTTRAAARLGGTASRRRSPTGSAPGRRRVCRCGARWGGETAQVEGVYHGELAFLQRNDSYWCGAPLPGTQRRDRRRVATMELEVRNPEGWCRSLPQQVSRGVERAQR